MTIGKSQFRMLDSIEPLDQTSRVSIMKFRDQSVRLQTTQVGNFIGLSDTAPRTVHALADSRSPKPLQGWRFLAYCLAIGAVLVGYLALAKLGIILAIQFMHLYM